MLLSPEEIRIKIESHIQIEHAAIDSWKSNHIPYEVHNAKLQMLQEILTFIDSGGANAL